MLTLIFTYIKEKSLSFKILLGVAVFLFFTATYYVAKYSYSEYLLLKSKEKELVILKEKIKISEEKTKKTISKGKSTTKKISKSKIEICFPWNQPP